MEKVTNKLGQSAEKFSDKSGTYCDYNDLDITAPQGAQIWTGQGYTGGHTSQAAWDTYQEGIKIYSLIKAGYGVQDLTREGAVSGYYPKVAYWKL